MHPSQWRRKKTNEKSKNGNRYRCVVTNHIIIDILESQYIVFNIHQYRAQAHIYTTLESLYSLHDFAAVPTYTVYRRIQFAADIDMSTYLFIYVDLSEERRRRRWQRQKLLSNLPF